MRNFADNEPYNNSNENQRPFRLKIMSEKPQFAICVKNGDYPASLQLWKVYRVLPDERGARHNMIRVIDESGEDYLFPQAILFR